LWKATPEQFVKCWKKNTESYIQTGSA